MIKRRARQAGLPQTTCCHTFRATGITSYLQNGGTIEHAQQIANHESPRTTKPYDRTNDAISLDETACPGVPGRACPAVSGRASPALPGIERILI
jgi:integrase